MTSFVTSATQEQNIIWTIRFESDKIFIAMVDGTELSIPLAWFPKLYYATPIQLSRYRIIGRGLMVRWVELDESISIKDLVG